MTAVDRWQVQVCCWIHIWPFAGLEQQKQAKNQDTLGRIPLNFTGSQKEADRMGSNIFIAYDRAKFKIRSCCSSEQMKLKSHQKGRTHSLFGPCPSAAPLF